MRIVVLKTCKRVQDISLPRAIFDTFSLRDRSSSLVFGVISQDGSKLKTLGDKKADRPGQGRLGETR